MNSQTLDKSPIALLETIRKQGRTWDDLAQQYGVTNPEPPWKVSLEGTCDALSAEDCALPALDRRWAGDELAESIYRDVPFPERQLLALAHTMIRRGLFDENELKKRLKEVHDRLTRE